MWGLYTPLQMLNPVLCADEHPLPCIKDLFATLSGGLCFNKLDTYKWSFSWHLANISQSINTQKALFCYNRLPFRTPLAPALFQKTMQETLKGLNGVQCYLDDILVARKSQEDHLQNLDIVLKPLEDHELRIHQDECKFFKLAFEYLGHVIDATGLRKSSENEKAVLQVLHQRACYS